MPNCNFEFTFSYLWMNNLIPAVIYLLTGNLRSDILGLHFDRTNFGGFYGIK